MSLSNETERFLKGRTSFPVYFACAEMVDDLTDEEAGRLFKAVIEYAQSQKDQAFNGDRLLGIVFKGFKKIEDDSRAKYLETCRKNSVNGKKKKTKTTDEDRAGDDTETNTSSTDEIIQSEGLPFK